MGPSRPANSVATAVKGASTVNAAQAVLGYPVRRIRLQASASGSPKGATKTSDSHANSGGGHGMSRTAEATMIPTGSHAKASRMNTERRSIIDTLSIIHPCPSVALRFRAGMSDAVKKEAHNYHNPRYIRRHYPKLRAYARSAGSSNHRR